MCACTYMTMTMTMTIVVLPLPQQPASSPTHHLHSTQYAALLRTQGARTNTVARWEANGGESRPWLSPASMLHLILHSAIRTFIPPSRATLFAFCSEAIQPASSLDRPNSQSNGPLAHHPVPSNAQLPSGPCSPPSRCHVGTAYLQPVLPTDVSV